MPRKVIQFFSFILCFLLVFQQTGFTQVAGELDISGHLAALHQSLTQEKFRPLHLRYLSYDQLKNTFNLLLDKGDFMKGLSPLEKGLSPSALTTSRTKGTVPEDKLKSATQELLNYFFTGVALPNNAFWVNLRPDSPDDIIDPSLERTEVGRILLEADLQLKKDTALATSPQTLQGKKYWDKLYQKAEELFGSENITIPTLTRPWIVPGEIIIREGKDNAYIYKSTLKVMLEEDYLAKGLSPQGTVPEANLYSFTDPRLKALNQYATQLVKELIIPKLTKEINTSKKYAPLRQVYYSLILAQWFKEKFRDSPLRIASKELWRGQSLSWSKNTYFQAYQKSFKDGEYNVQEPRYTPYGQSIRTYFSGGIAFGANEILRCLRAGAIPAANSRELVPGKNIIRAEVTSEGDVVHIMALEAQQTIPERETKLSLAELEKKYQVKIVILGRGNLSQEARKKGLRIKSDDHGFGYFDRQNDQAYAYIEEGFQNDRALVIHEITEAIGRAVVTGVKPAGTNTGGTGKQEDAASLAAARSSQLVKRLFVLEAELNSSDNAVSGAAAEALGPIYATLVSQGEMSLSDLEAKLNVDDENVCMAAVEALGPVYKALVSQGKTVSLLALESKLKVLTWPAVRRAAAEALGPIYAALVSQGKMSLSDLEAKLNDNDLAVRRAAAKALSPAYASLVNQGKTVSLSLAFLETKLDDDETVSIPLAQALGLMYLNLVNQGEMPLSAVESKLRNRASFVRVAAAKASFFLRALVKEIKLAVANPALIKANLAVFLQYRYGLPFESAGIAEALGPIYVALVIQGKMSLSALEAKLNSSNEVVFKAAVKALCPVYTALVNEGKMSLSDLEAKLNHNERAVRRAAAEALGPIYAALVNEGETVSLSALEAKLKDFRSDSGLWGGDMWEMPRVAAKALCPIYAALVNQGETVYISSLEAILNDNKNDGWKAATEALGPIYAALVSQGEISLPSLETRLNDYNRNVRRAGDEALNSTYVALINNGQLLTEDYTKYLLWQKTGLPSIEGLFVDFINADNPNTFLEEIEQIKQDIQQGGFDINNQRHLWVNYILVTEQLKLSPIKRQVSWEDYLKIIDNVKNGEKGWDKDVSDEITSEHELEIRGLAYEGYVLRNKILEIQQRAQQLGRPVIVVENLSYGAVASSPITEGRNGSKYIIGTDIPVISTKIGSSECHHDEFYTRYNLFTEAEQKLLLEKKPIVIVIDASTSVSAPERTSPHIPDGFKGYRNYFIAIDTALGISVDAPSFQEDEKFLEELKDSSVFKMLTAELKTRGTQTQVNQPYRLFFWYPGEKQLYLRVNKKVATPTSKLKDINELKGPAVVFVQAAMEPEAVPAKIKQNFIKGQYTPAYFDDKDNFKQFYLDYEEGYGLMVSRRFINLARRYFAELRELLKEPAVLTKRLEYLPPRRIDYIAMDLDGTFAETDKVPNQEALYLLNSLLRKGKKPLFITEDIEQNLDSRLINLLPLDVRANLAIFSDGGTNGYTFDVEGRKVHFLDYNQKSRISHDLRVRILNLLAEHFSGQYTLDTRANRISSEYRIDLRNITVDRSKFIRQASDLLTQAGISAKVYKVGKTSIKIVLQHKEDALRYWVKKNQADISRVLIVGDSAKTNQVDRDLLASFPEAVSVSVGRYSNTIAKQNPNIIQLVSEGIPGTLRILSVLDKQGALPANVVAPSNGISKLGESHLSEPDRGPGATPKGEPPSYTGAGDTSIHKAWDEALKLEQNGEPEKAKQLLLDLRRDLIEAQNRGDIETLMRKYNSKYGVAGLPVDLMLKDIPAFISQIDKLLDRIKSTKGGIDGSTGSPSISQRENKGSIEALLPGGQRAEAEAMRDAAQAQQSPEVKPTISNQPSGRIDKMLQETQDIFNNPNALADLKATAEEFRNIYTKLSEAGELIISRYQELALKSGLVIEQVKLYVVGGRTNNKPLDVKSDIDLIFSIKYTQKSLQLFEKSTQNPMELSYRINKLHQGIFDITDAVCKELGIPNKFHIIPHSFWDPSELPFVSKDFTAVSPITPSEDKDKKDIGGINNSSGSLRNNSNQERNNPGGIDFRAIPIVTQPMPFRDSPLGATSGEIWRGQSLQDSEWQQIQKMLDGGITPSLERIRCYLLNYRQQDEFNQAIDKVLSCLADILRIEEESCVATDSATRQLLVLLESNQSAQEISISLDKIKVAPKEPKAVP